MCFASKSAGANAPKPCGKAYRLWCYDALPSTVALWLRTVEGARFSDSFDTHTPFSSFSLRSIQRGVLRLSVRLYLVAGAKKIHRTFVRCIFLPQRRPTFPGSCPPSIIGTSELNYCVRYGYRCVLCVIVTEFSKYDTSFISSLINFPILLGQALGLLVSVSLIHYCTYTSDLSTT